MDKTIMITGASTGIGASIAMHFSKLGYNVIITYYKDQEKAQKIYENLDQNKKNSIFQLDVRDENSVIALRNKVDKHYKSVDVLVCNAGVDFFAEIEKITFEDWNEIIQTKLNGSFLMTKYFYPLLHKSKKSYFVLFILLLFFHKNYLK